MLRYLKTHRFSKKRMNINYHILGTKHRVLQRLNVALSKEGHLLRLFWRLDLEQFILKSPLGRERGGRKERAFELGTSVSMQRQALVFTCIERHAAAICTWGPREGKKAVFLAWETLKKTSLFQKLTQIFLQETQLVATVLNEGFFIW